MQAQPDLTDMRVAQLQIERAPVYAEGHGSSLARVATALLQLRAWLSYLTEHPNPR